MSTEVTYRLSSRQVGQILTLINASQEPSARHTRDRVGEKIRAALKSLGDAPDPNAAVAVDLTRQEIGGLKLALLELHGRDKVTGSDVAFVRETARTLRIWEKQILPILVERESSVEAVANLDDESQELDPEPDPEPNP